MQLLITTVTADGYEAGDVIAVVSDSHTWGKRETLAAWVASGETARSFPNPAFAVVKMDGEPPDPNLADGEVENDPEETDATRPTKKRAWKVDLDRVARRVRTDLEAPGAVVEFRRADRTVVRRKSNDDQMPLRLENDGETKERNAESSARRHVSRVPLRRSARTQRNRFR